MAMLQHTYVAVDNHSDFNLQRRASSKWLTPTDLVVYGLLLGLGALQFALVLRSNDFFTGDTTYFELARSIISEGFYGFNFKPETLLPPGFPLILASLCATLSCTYTILIRSMAVFATLGFIASYELLRREEGRTIAAVSCLLLASSPIVFAFSTRMVFSDLPYFFTSISTLLLATKLDRANSSRERLSLWLLCGCLLTGSLLIRSSGIALLMGLFGWLAVSRFPEREVRLRRLRTFVPLLVAGLLVEILWMQWAARNEVLQWPMVGGYPQPYFAQLHVKSGNYPELGAASLSDIPPRVAENLADRAVALFALLTRKDYINPAWFSPAVFSVVLLVLLGVGTSVWHWGGDWPVWYFISHEAVYLLWPWDFEMRFFLPVAPLACLYLWRGGKALVDLASRKPRALGLWSLPLSVLLGVYAGASGWYSGRLQPALAAIFWGLVAAVAALMAWRHSYQMPLVIGPFLTLSRIVGQRFLRIVPIGGVVAVAILVGTGVAQQISIGRNNLAFDLTKQPSYPDIVGAKWIHDHTASAVVMARQLDVVHHYSRLKVVWFPPSSDAQLLMKGIRKYKVEFVIVNERQNSYWLPPEDECFESLSRAYPTAFQLVHQEPQLRIYKIIPDFAQTRIDSLGSFFPIIVRNV